MNNSDARQTAAQQSPVCDRKWPPSPICLSEQLTISSAWPGLPVAAVAAETLATLLSTGQWICSIVIPQHLNSGLAPPFQTVNVGAATANPAECSHLSRQKVPGLAFRHPLCGCFVSVASALHKIADACAQHEDPNNPGQEQVPSPS